MALNLEGGRQHRRIRLRELRLLLLEQLALMPLLLGGAYPARRFQHRSPWDYVTTQRTLDF